MTKYRIRKVVSYYPEWDNKLPKVWYKIEWKCLWWWESLNEVLGSKESTFSTVEGAENALKTHAKILDTLASDGKIEKVLKL